MLDIKDKKLLVELEMKARVTNASLAKKLKISKQAIKYRIEKLEKEKIIQGYNAIIDLNKLGKTIYVVYIKTIRISSQIEKQWFQEIQKNKDVIGVGKNAGHWDMTIAISAGNNQELDYILKKIISNKSDKIKEKLITSEIESSYFNIDIIENSKTLQFNTSIKKQNISIDDKEKKLIELLSNNCRLTLVQLAGKLKMSANGVKNRILSLQKKEIIIGYKTKINYEKLGFLHFRVFLHLKKLDSENYKLIKQFLKKQGNVESVSRYLGYADIDFRCYTKNIFELYKLISEIKDKFLQNIIEVNSMPIFDWEKIEFVK